ncbi:MAG: macro domain-containing protein [Sulfurimonadaceae bacterium]
MSYICTVKQGDLLTEEDATFIVNASNTRLVLGSGVSMAFRDHCGKALQDEMSESLENMQEPLRQGDVIATSPGAAVNFKYALHAAIMNYDADTNYDDSAPTLDVIKRSLENIEGYLVRYDEKNSKPMKLVLALMGCGVGNLNKEDVIQLYKAFFEREVSFTCEVVVYGHSRGDYELIKSILKC